MSFFLPVIGGEFFSSPLFVFDLKSERMGGPGILPGGPARSDSLTVLLRRERNTGAGNILLLFDRMSGAFLDAFLILESDEFTLKKAECQRKLTGRFPGGGGNGGGRGISSTILPMPKAQCLVYIWYM